MKLKPDKFLGADKLVVLLVPDHADNDRVVIAARDNKNIHITPKQIEAAMTEKRAAEAKAALVALDAQDAQDVMTACGVALVLSERQFIGAWIRHQGWDMDYGRNLLQTGQPRWKDHPRLPKNKIEAAIQLDASEYGLVHKDGFKEKNLGRALTEFCDTERAMRRSPLWRDIDKLSDDRDAPALQAATDRLFAHLFDDPAFRAGGGEKDHLVGEAQNGRVADQAA